MKSLAHGGAAARRRQRWWRLRAEAAAEEVEATAEPAAKVVAAAAVAKEHELEQGEQDHERGDDDGATETVFEPVNECAVAQMRPLERLG